VTITKGIDTPKGKRYCPVVVGPLPHQARLGDDR
jgi:hypothetical protein